MDRTHVTLIYIYKLDCPSEELMFDLRFKLQFESFSTLIGNLELGLVIEIKAN